METSDGFLHLMAWWWMIWSISHFLCQIKMGGGSTKRSEFAMVAASGSVLLAADDARKGSRLQQPSHTCTNQIDLDISTTKVDQGGGKKSSHSESTQNTTPNLSEIFCCWPAAWFFLAQLVSNKIFRSNLVQVIGRPSTYCIPEKG